MNSRNLYRHAPAALFALIVTLIALFAVLIPPARAAAVTPADGVELVAPPTGNASADSILTWAIPVVVPLVLAGVKKIMPKLPGGALPILAAILGGVIDYANHVATGHASNTLTAVALGLAGVGLREVKEAVLKAENGGWPASPGPIHTDNPPANLN